MNNTLRILILVNSLLLNTVMGMELFYQNSEYSKSIKVLFLENNFLVPDKKSDAMVSLILRQHQYNKDLYGGVLKKYSLRDNKLMEKRLSSSSAAEYFDFYFKSLDGKDYLKSSALCFPSNLFRLVIQEQGF